MIQFKMDGLDKLQRKLSDLAKLDKTKVPLTEFLTPSFVQRYTKFSTAEELFDASGFEVTNAEDFKKITDADWDSFISKVSNFQSWDAMLSKAAELWFQKKLKI